MYPLLRSLLQALPPEAAHRFAVAAMAAWGSVAPRPLLACDAPAKVMGLDFPNRIGLAAGLDKDALAARGFASLGFGFIEVGTVTPQPQLGNSRPRLFRSERDQALINRMGFNSAGLEAVCQRLARLRQRPLRALLGVNIGKNRDTALERTAEDYLRCLQAVHPFADYIAVNLSSPNTPGLRALQSANAARTLLAALVRQRDALSEAGRHVPLAVKVSPDLDAERLAETAAAVRSAGADAVIATNTTTARPPGLAPAFAAEAGGLSGAPLTQRAKATVAIVRDALGPGFPIIGVGGILCAADADAMFDAGADLLQVYTGLVLKGPGLVRKLQAVVATRAMSRRNPARADTP